MIKKYNEFIFEANEETSSNISQEIKDEVKKMIEETVQKRGGDYNSFVEKFLEGSEDIKIESLINDSDVFDFYLKWRNDVDPILNSVKFFDESPNKLGKLGLYEYVVEGTNRAVKTIIDSLGQ